MPLAFAAPLFLFGLLSLVIPILLLLTKSRTARTEDFSSLFFLRTITEKSARVIEWKKLLLLLVRLALLLLLTLAFTLPFLEKQRAILFGKPIPHAAFVLDTSYSMGYVNEGDSLFKKARKAISETVSRELSKETLVSFYTFNNSLKTHVVESEEPQLVLDKIAQEEVSDFSSEFGVFKNSVEETVCTGGNKITTIYFYSDLNIEDRLVRKNLPASIIPECPNTEFKWIPFQPGQYQNFVIDNIQLPIRPFLPNEAGPIEVTYRNYGKRKGTIPLQMRLDGRLVQEKQVDVSVEGSSTVQFDFMSGHAGSVGIVVSAPWDALDVDNERTAVATVRPRLKVLLVEGYQPQYAFEGPYYFMNKVFQSFAGAEEEESLVELTKVSISQAAKTSLDQYDAVVLADIPQFGARELSAITYYVKRGGVVIFAPGAKSQIGEYSKNAYLKKLLGGHFGPVVNSEGPEPAFQITQVPYEHKMFEVFKGGIQGDLEGVKVSAFAPFIPEKDSKAGDILLWFNNKWPALIDRELDAGRVIIWTTTLNADWTEFPKRPLYVPFLLELLKFTVIEKHGSTSETIVGRGLEFNYKQSSQVSVMDPGGNQSLFYLDAALPTAFMEVESAGLYEVLQQKGKSVERILVAANLDTAESNPNYTQPEIFKRMSQESTLQDPTLEGVDKFKRRDFFYRPLLIVVLILLFLETFLANRIYKTYKESAA